MYRLISRIARLLPAMQPAAFQDDVAHKLMERAEVRAGRHPHQAQELRNAACAYLRVVR